MVVIMNSWVIFIITFGCIVGFFIFLFLVNLIFIGAFSKRLKSHKNAFIIILAQRYEGLAVLINVLEKNKIAVPDNILQLYGSIDVSSFENLDSIKCIENRKTMSILKQEIMSLVKNNEEIFKNQEFKNLITMFSSIDDQTRVAIASYNSDVAGYNYWIRFKPFKYFFVFNNVLPKQSLF